MVYEEKWYDCETSEMVAEQPMPDFSKAPADKRDMLEKNWLQKNAKSYSERCLMWGPQIARQPELNPNRKVIVLGEWVKPEGYIEPPGRLPPKRIEE